MKRPSFQFYVGDWLRNAKLRRCSPAARGAWIDVLCLLHDSEEYGILRWPLADIAQAAGVPVKLLRELSEKGVLKGSDKRADPYIYRPRHAGQEGDPVTLIEAGDGPCWYCSRFVRDEHVRQKRGTSTRFEGDKPSPNEQPKAPPIPPIGGRQGDGASTSTSTSVDQEHSLRSERTTTEPGAATPAGAVCARLKRDAGYMRVNPSDPHLLAALSAGVSGDLLVEVAKEFPSKPLAYIASTALGRHNDAAVMAAGGKHGPAGQPRRVTQLDRIRLANSVPSAPAEPGGPDGHCGAGRTIDGYAEEA